MTPALVEKLNTTIAGIMKSEATRKSLIEQGIDPVYGTPQDLLALTKSEMARWQQAVEQAGAKLSQ
jgi:tripartite-type tricarboxylate transporter receptor subunit TctC